ncbi:MAG: GIY-YIG nuclease family protein [Gemmatimonadota bacterium]
MLPLPATDLDALRLRVSRLAENRPGVYRMLDPTGRVLYVGKAKKLRTRVLSYFRASYPDDKAARILHAARTIEWDYVPSEFAAYLTELRLIRRHRPPLNHSLNRTRRVAFIRVMGGPAPRISSGATVGGNELRCFGPFNAGPRVHDAVRTLNDLLGLRDCAPNMPIVYAGQMDLFNGPLAAACIRHELGFCSGPCAGFVTELDYRHRVETAVAFLDARAIAPIDRVIDQMQAAAEASQFERATRWREKFEILEWLLAAVTRARAALDLLTFVYRDPGTLGDDRAYLIRRGLVRATYPYPTTPIELDAFKSVVIQELSLPEPNLENLATQGMDEVLLVMSWFRQHPDAFRRTSKLEEWVN